MRVVLLSHAFSRNMGYLENMLPKYLARNNVEVHVVTMDLAPYYWLKEFETTYRGFMGELRPGMVERFDGYTLHVLPHKKVAGYMRMVGLGKKLRSLRPDIVQTTTAIGWSTLQAAICRPFLGYKLFTGSHMAATMFPLAKQKVPWWNHERLKCRLMRGCPGRLASLVSEKCYTPTEDCALIASRYFGVQSRKVEVMYLGVDTECFYHNANGVPKERWQLRRKLGFNDQEIVCIYTGKFRGEKKLELLLQAIDQLRSHGEPYRALFIGDGPQKKGLVEHTSSVVLAFMPVAELAQYYRASDIGVWPGNESTSMLDAAACGLPIVISDDVCYRAPIDGNGKVFQKNNAEDLARVLLELRKPEVRQSLGSNGAARMARDFSWESVAGRRLRDYEAALGGK